MDEDKFWNYAGGGDNEFEYGRMVLTDDVFEAFLKLPFSKIELKPKPEIIFEELKRIDPREKADDGYQKRLAKIAIN